MACYLASRSVLALTFGALQQLLTSRSLHGTCCSLGSLSCWTTPYIGLCCCCVPAIREMEEATKRHNDQQVLLNSRIAELDAEGRKLREQKYQLDTQVRVMYS